MVQIKMMNVGNVMNLVIGPVNVEVDVKIDDMKENIEEKVNQEVFLQEEVIVEENEVLVMIEKLVVQKNLERVDVLFVKKLVI